MCFNVWTESSDFTTWRSYRDIDFPEQKKTETIEKMASLLVNKCSTCSVTVESEAAAFQCDYCEEWEHVDCVRAPDRPSEEIYAAMSNCHVKCILYCCSRCRSKGSITKRLIKLELESARARTNQCWPASGCLTKGNLPLRVCVASVMSLHAIKQT